MPKANKDNVLEGEVFDMNEMPHSESRETSHEKPQRTPLNKKSLAVVLMLAALVYDLIPVDLMPFLPFDDLGLTAAAMLNLFQQFAQDQDSSLVRILKYAKWTFVTLVAIAVLLFVGLIILMVNPFAR